jgi:peptidoglycan/xylan/chitin deacetylase (PgdA/CDA1 family)
MSGRSAVEVNVRESLPRAISLMYHDVVDPGRPDSSGFPGKGPAQYKLDWPLFERHLEVIAAAGKSPRGVMELAASDPPRDDWPLLLTFDDGGASAERIGSVLRDAECVGHFFITTERIGTPGFLDEGGVAGLAQMGHVIGTHSCSHHVPFSELSEEQLLEEWSRSIDVLTTIVGQPIVVGSVPGGYLSRRVARTAARSGLKALFTSEPVARSRELDGCLQLGRYAILAGTTPETVARLVRGSIAPRVRQLISWKVRGAAKAVLGDGYRTLRSRVLERA